MRLTFMTMGVVVAAVIPYYLAIPFVFIGDLIRSSAFRDNFEDRRVGMIGAGPEWRGIGVQGRRNGGDGGGVTEIWRGTAGRGMEQRRSVPGRPWAERRRT